MTARFDAILRNATALVASLAVAALFVSAAVPVTPIA